MSLGLGAFHRSTGGSVKKTGILQEALNIACQRGFAAAQTKPNQVAPRKLILEYTDELLSLCDLLAKLEGRYRSV